MTTLHRRLSLINCQALVIIAIFLCWKLLRLISPSPFFWALHLYVLAIILVLSFLMMFRTHLYNNKTNTFLPITSFLFIVFAFFAILRSIVFNSFYDVFFVATISFNCYFLFLAFFSKIDEIKFFKGIEFLLMIVLLINFTQIIDINFLEAGLYYYGEMPKFIGDMNPSNHRVNIFIPFYEQLGLPSSIVRVSGVSGSPYSSSALVAAIAIYSYFLNNKKLFYLAFLQLLLFSVVTSLVVFFAFLLYLNRRKRIIILLTIIVFVFSSFIFHQRGVDEIAPWLENEIMYTNGTEYILALIFGEGLWNPQVHTEIRLIEVFFSLGIIGTALLSFILINFYKFVKATFNFHFHKNYYASWLFIMVLLICSLHYHTFLLFPNIIFVIAFIAYAASRNNRNIMLLN